MKLKLRQRQVEALTAAKERYQAGVRRQLIQLPTGVGKTPTFAALREFFGFKKKVLVLVHKEELAMQAKDKLQKWNPDETVGVEMADHTHSPSDTFVVASVPTIGRENVEEIKDENGDVIDRIVHENTRLTQFDPDEFDAVICDEAHHAVAESWLRVLHYFGFINEDLDGPADTLPERLLLGVTATPNRGDRKALKIAFDELVYQYPILDAVREGWLSVPYAFVLHTTTSLNKVRTVRGDFVREELAHAVDNPVRNGLIVKGYIEHARGMRAVVFAVNIKHSKHLAEEFNRHGVRAAAVWGIDPERDEKLAAYEAGELDVIVNVDVLTEGVDIWQIDCVILGAPTKSQLKMAQRIGRGLRIEPHIAGMGLLEARKQGIEITKDKCLILEVSDRNTKHSLASLPSIFGLPAKLDLGGRTITEVADVIEAKLEENEDLDFGGLVSLDDIDSYIEDVDLFGLVLPDSMRKVSEFGWYKTPAGTFMLKLTSTHERIEVYKDLTGHWNVKGTIKANHFMHGGFKHAEDGVRFADGMVRMLGQGMLKDLKKRGKADSVLASRVQWTLIRKLAVNANVDKLPDKLTKGEATRLIEALCHAGLEQERKKYGVASTK